MPLVYIGLGSNLDDPIDQIQSAIKEINAIPHCTIEKTSSFYTTKAIGPPQPEYINAVIALTTVLHAHELLSALQAIELAHKRARLIHLGPRTLDLDILLFGDETINTERLTVPHPRMHQRNFVLIPLQEINSDISIPNIERSIDALIVKNGTDDFVMIIN